MADGDSSSNNAIIALALVVIVLLAIGTVVWFSKQPVQTPSPQPGTTIDVNLPGGNAPDPSPSQQ